MNAKCEIAIYNAIGDGFVTIRPHFMQLIGNGTVNYTRNCILLMVRGLEKDRY